jgi:hypothetical protein
VSWGSAGEGCVQAASTIRLRITKLNLGNTRPPLSILSLLTKV